MWDQPLKFEARPPAVPWQTLDTLTAAVRADLAAGGDPDVGELFFLDAEWAPYNGRFRECVLFCWSTIDASFNRKYESLVNIALAGEWSDGRQSLTSVDFGLRNKMTAVMHLLANRSLFRERGGGLWPDLSASYTKRNDIIHRGVVADESDAKRALAVAREVVHIMNALWAHDALCEFSNAPGLVPGV